MTESLITVVRSDGDHPHLDLVDGEGEATALIWPGMGAEYRTIQRFELSPGSCTVPLRHDGEAVYFVLSGEVEVVDAGEPIPVVSARSVVHIAAGKGYRFRATEPSVVVGGPCPPDHALYDQANTERTATQDSGDASSEGLQIVHADDVLPSLPMISADARLLAWPGSGAETANMNYVVLEPGEANRPHAHATSEDTIVIVEGQGSIEDLTHGVIHEFAAGDVVHVPAGLRHAVRADRGARIVSVGGPCPPDFALLRAAGALPA